MRKKKSKKPADRTSYIAPCPRCKSDLVNGRGAEAKCAACGQSLVRAPESDAPNPYICALCKVRFKGRCRKEIIVPGEIRVHQKCLGTYARALYVEARELEQELREV